MSDISDISEMRRKRILDRKRAIRERCLRNSNESYGAYLDALDRQINHTLSLTESQDEPDE